MSKRLSHSPLHPSAPVGGARRAPAATVYADVAVTIRRPRQEVAAVMFDPRHDAAWIRRVRTVRLMAPGPLQRGVKLAREWRMLGRRIAEISEVVEHVPERSVAITTQLPLGLSLRYELEGIPEGTIARVRAEGRIRAPLRLMVPLLNAAVRAATLRDLRRLKRLLESGAWRHLVAATGR